MRELTHHELPQVAGGDLSCTVSGGTGGFNVSCTGSPGDFMSALGSAYDGLVSATADLMCSATGNC